MLRIEKKMETTIEGIGFRGNTDNGESNGQ